MIDPIDSRLRSVLMQFTHVIKVRLLDKMGGDSSIAAAAKVLEPEAYEEYKQTHEVHSTEGLIRYLMQHRHGTPFEHGTIQIFVHAPIFVWREWHRHRIGFSYNEESARYKQLDPVFYLPPKSRPMFRVENWKPGRPKFLRWEETGTMAEQMEAEAKYSRFIERKKAQYQSAYQSYVDSLNEGFDPGLARIDLPVGIYSSCWVTFNPRSAMAFLSLRTHEETAKFVSYPLYEIEVAARLVEEIFKIKWPLTHKAFCDFGRVGP